MEVKGTSKVHQSYMKKVSKGCQNSAKEALDIYQRGTMGASEGFEDASEGFKGAPKVYLSVLTLFPWIFLDFSCV